ncbi:MAG: hypothetical protein M1822_003396 [Bathelium mastoideum]|nr:MAG: hypothetical protein M1822_003396 [Bathelium mastoideum]
MNKKRAFSQYNGSEAREEKRRKATDGATVPVKIESARHLQQLLVFSQDDPIELRNNIRSFKNFLESILYDEDENLKKERRSLLKEYLESQKPKHEDHVFLRDVEEAWSFASQTQNDPLFSSVTAVLVLLFRVISGHLDFRDYGFQLGRMILHFNQVKLVSRGLSAPAHKEFVISPCLRLLTEVVSFDAGALAKQVYAKRDFTFDTKTTTRNLQLKKTNAEQDQSDPKRIQTVRTTAVRYLLAHLKYQDEGVKMDILRNGNITRALFVHLHEDPQHVVKEILAVAKSNILRDNSLPRQTKSQVMNYRTLADVAALYRVNKDPEVGEESVQKMAHEFLLLVCTEPDLGVLLRTSGWYPPGTDREISMGTHSSVELSDVHGDRPQKRHLASSIYIRDDVQDNPGIDLGLDSVDWHNSFQDDIPVRNVILSSFIQGLRPYANQLERELLVTIFKSAPELVASYFFKKRNFQFDPKLTATWIGYASVLFTTVELPVPPWLGRRTTYHSVPPPVSIAIESILPQPLSQRILKKCLNSQSDLIILFTIRILTMAFEKLRTVLRMFNEAAEERGPLWKEGATRLIEAFTDRCPTIREVITTFQQTAKTNLMRRESITRLLALYFQVIPSIAFDEKFDIAPVLAEALQHLENDEIDPETRQMRLLELSHLITIARWSPEMRWFNKPQILRFSPFITLLKLVTRNSFKGFADTAMELLVFILADQGILQTETPKPSVDVLIYILRTSQNEGASDAFLDFLDDCVQRFVRRPLKYLDDLEMLEQEQGGQQKGIGPISMVLVTMIEQWAFAPRNRSDAVYSLGRIIDAYLALSERIGEDEYDISILRRKFHETIEKSELDRSQLSSATLIDAFQIEEQKHDEVNSSSGTAVQPQTTEDQAMENKEWLTAYLPPPEPESHPDLLRWMHKDIDSIVEENLISGLILCLSSTTLSIRKEALTNIRKLAARLIASAHPERHQLHLLLLELAETADRSSPIADAPLPFTATIFAARAATTVLADPTHCLYPKLNRFLNRGPAWRVGRLPASWRAHVFLQPPSEDDHGARVREIAWLLDWLFDALRTPADAEIFRVCGVWERVLAYYAAPFTVREAKARILEMVARATAVEGASTTLITRFGVVAWLDMMMTLRDGDVAMLRTLRGRLLETCDRARIAEWSAGMLIPREQAGGAEEVAIEAEMEGVPSEMPA